MTDTKNRALKTAFPLTVPIMAAFAFLGLSYGILMNQAGFNFVYPFVCSLLIFAGSIEFMTIGMLATTFDPINVLLLTLIVNARHVFYGISSLERFKSCDWKKWYLIFGMCDGTFSILSNAEIPDDVDKDWFMFFVTGLIHLYWVIAATIGGIVGSFITVEINGLSFVMTALFIVLFLDRVFKEEDHFSSLAGVVISIICLIIFGSEHFILPTMLMLLIVIIGKTKQKRRERLV
ncbi:AzlC family ABC transporter permease [Enterococcus sp. 669A]|uniref:AzlC family ABC transporter permease n=1 Tax=Candidatus Enterococcus moelleringii TaxID=2815325 RepID=A0ABS3L9J4_9ENTE|nr:AzlC family ABC transporter permease [Enterococcus sp. 669A]MBO1306294.1 AzlC family ABC transporter permease [Enterococcus sp. 669A]